MSSGIPTSSSAGDAGDELEQSNAPLIDAVPVLVIRADYPPPDLQETGPLEDLGETLDDTLPPAE